MAQLAARLLAGCLVLLASILLLVTISSRTPARVLKTSQPQLHFNVDSVDEALAEFGPLCPGPEGTAEKGERNASWHRMWRQLAHKAQCDLHLSGFRSSIPASSCFRNDLSGKKDGASTSAHWTSLNAE